MTDEKRPAPGQITWKSQSTGDKKRILSTFRENKTGHTKNQKTATLEARRQWTKVFNNWEENDFQPWIWCPANLANQELEEHKPIFPTGKFSENSPIWALFLRKDVFLYSRDKATEADRKWQIWPRTEGNHRWWCQRAPVRARSQVWGEMSPDWGQVRGSWSAEEEETERIYLMHPNDARGYPEH